ncbi:hypothetical protein, partial [Micromonospora tarensis]|uniref:hypothetical protein n=1 Tax=Micromonospora tarensis TaxID=2806100 RepID=UPI001EE42B67
PEKGAGAKAGAGAGAGARSRAQVGPWGGRGGDRLGFSESAVSRWARCRDFHEPELIIAERA